MRETSINFIPEPPDFRVDWDSICATFAWVREMYKVPQDARWHAEGDVGIHTRMVAEALAEDSQWQNADEQTRRVIFMAALLHDVAKGRTLRIDPDGRIGSPKHSQVGERMARMLLWRGLAGEILPLAIRERIASMVRHHGLPLRFLDKPDPERAVITASLTARLDDVAVLTRADVIGRTFAGKQELLDRVEMFKELAAEHHCLCAPYTFESHHHRFVYCNELKPIHYVPFDDRRSEATVLSGLPAMGKDSWIKQNAKDASVVSMDDLRAELDVDPGDRNGQGVVAQAARDRARTLLRDGAPLFWNATNITRQVRQSVTSLCHAYRARIRIVYVECAYDEMLRRNRARSAPVPGDVIERLTDKLEMPGPAECHEFVTVQTD